MWPGHYPGYAPPLHSDIHRNIALSEEVERLAVYSSGLEDEVARLRKDNTILADTVDARDKAIAELE